MALHSKYTDYKITYKDKYTKRLQHITEHNLTIKIEYYKSGGIQAKIWYLNNKIYRKDGAARIDYYKSGEIKYEGWIINHKWHREDGPAMIEYDKSGKIISCKFYLNDIEYTYDKFIQTPEYHARLKQKSITIFD